MTPEEINAEALRITEATGLPLAPAMALYAAIVALAEQVRAGRRKHNWSPESRAAAAARMKARMGANSRAQSATQAEAA